MGSLFTSKQKTESSPYGPAQPAIDQGIQGIENLYESGGFRVNPYQGQRVADINPTEMQGLDAIVSGAGDRSAYLTNAMNTSTGVMNSGVQDLADIERGAVGDAINAANNQFMNAGMEGSSLHQAEAVGAATRAIAPIRYGANEDAMMRQLRAASLAPQLASAAAQPGADVARAGARLTAQDQAVLDAQQAQYREGEMAPISEQEMFSRLAAQYGGMGGTVVNTSTPSPWEIAGNVAQTAMGIYGGFGGGMGGGGMGGFNGGAPMSSGFSGGSPWMWS